jgi:hypothetical protein
MTINIDKGNQPVQGTECLMTNKGQLAQVKMADLEWSNAAVVAPCGFRFLIPVPNLGAEIEVIQAKDWRGEPKTVTGFAFTNGTDSAAQAVVGDGTGVIIVNINTDKMDRNSVSRTILNKIQDLGGAPSLNKEKLTELLKFINEELKVTDVYDSTDKIAENLHPQGELGMKGGGLRPLGLFEKVDKSGPRAVFVSGQAEVLDGPHAGTANYESGFMAVQIAPKKEGGDFTYRSIALEAITSCYKMADGSPISNPKEQLPVVEV